MNIQIESLFLAQNGIEYTWSNNGGDESEIEKMRKEDFAKLLCEHSDGTYSFFEGDILPGILIKEGHQVTEDNLTDVLKTIDEVVKSDIEKSFEYCCYCLAKHIESQNKN